MNCLLMLKNCRVDPIVQSTAVTKLETLASALMHKLAILPRLYGKLTATLLLLKKSKFGEQFLDRFDATVVARKLDGS